MSLPKSEWPPDEVAEAKRRFLAAAVPLNPLLIVKHRPISSVLGTAAIGVVLGVMAESSLVRAVTRGWLSKLFALALPLIQTYGFGFLNRTHSAGHQAENQNAVG